MILAIDFDNVIMDTKHPVEGKRMGLPIEGAQESIVKFARWGYTVIIFTLRGDEKGRGAVAEWMKFYGMPYYKEITNIKPQCDYYIDDKAIHFTTWDEVRAQLK
jgi:hypothetical protein